jgi:hypothetical protein
MCDAACYLLKFSTYTNCAKGALVLTARVWKALLQTLPLLLVLLLCLLSCSSAYLANGIMADSSEVCILILICTDRIHFYSIVYSIRS